VADAVVASVEADRVQAVEPLHPRRELRLRRLDEEMEVVVEQDPDVNLPAKTALDFDQQRQPRHAIDVVEHDRPLLDAATDHLVPGGARQLRASDPRHEATLARGGLPRNRREGTSFRDSP
jgi:hypothetical protein